MPPSRQQGFVLVVTLWILAIITIGTAYFAERVASSVTLAQQSQQTTQALLDFSNTRADILFRLATTPPSIYGLGPTLKDAISLDNRPYRGSGQDTVRLQDSRGLINVNFIQPGVLRQFLGVMGVAAENREALLDSLNDYTDTDDLRRLNGAEAAEYSARGLPLPPNDWLVTPWQLQNIIGWREQATLWKDQKLTEMLSTARVNAFNPNSAPREVLAALPGSSFEIADQLIKMRTLQPLLNAAQLGGLVGQGGLDSESLLFFPSNTFQLTQESDKAAWALRYQITLTPLADRAPWRIVYYLKTGITSPAQNANNPLPIPPPLPARVALPAVDGSAL